MSLATLEQAAQNALNSAFATRTELQSAKEKVRKLEDEYYALTQAARTATQALADAVTETHWDAIDLMPYESQGAAPGTGTAPSTGAVS